MGRTEQAMMANAASGDKHPPCDGACPTDLGQALDGADTIHRGELECHGTLPCLHSGSFGWVWSALFKPIQKIRSYTVWYRENMGWRAWARSTMRPWADRDAAFLDRRNPSAESESLALQPGEIVEVKPVEAILVTLDSNRRHKGLRWMTGMRQFCGGRYRVYKRLDMIMLETGGELRRMKDTVLLEGVVCDGKEFGGCDRSCFHFWREAWLRRVPQ